MTLSFVLGLLLEMWRVNSIGVFILEIEWLFLYAY